MQECTLALAQINTMTLPAVSGEPVRTPRMQA